MDRGKPVGAAHVDLVVFHDEIAALDDLDAHLAGEKAVLEVGGVVDAGREQHDGGVGHVDRGQMQEEIEQVVGVVLNRAHAVVAQHVGENTLHHLTVFQHVADAGGSAEIVFENAVGAGFVADQIGAVYVDVEVAGNLAAEHLGTEIL